MNTVREDPIRKGLLFAGTETGVWFSLDEGEHWRSLELNLPHTSMRDLWIKDDDLIVATHGRSFWILDDISPLRELDKIEASATPYLVQPAAAFRVRRSTNTDTPLPADEPAGENPPAGAILDYSLPPWDRGQSAGPVTLEILDADNHLVRRYASTDTPEATREELSKQLIPLYWLKMPEELSATTGMHRWVWDLRYATPVAAHYEYPISAVPGRTPRTPQGPLALPGRYTVRLTAGGKTVTAPLVIKMDPRLSSTEADLQELFTLESSLATMVSRSSAASLQAHAVREQLEKLPQGTPSASRGEVLDSSLKALLEGQEAGSTKQAAPGPGKQEAAGPAKQAATGPGKQAVIEEANPGLDELVTEAGTLYTQVGQADAAPTQAQQQAVAHAGEELSGVLRRWESLRNLSIPALN